MSNYQRCGSFVTARIRSLAADPAALSPYARGVLANLRRGVGKVPGSVPQVWEVTMLAGDEPSGVRLERAEVAVHVALTHWAYHQQSKPAPMHRPERSLGEALRILAAGQNRSAVHQTAAYRRMMALAASRSLTGISTHSRGLIGQLRAAGIGFDYGRWADDLYWIQVPGRLADVQRRWGRDFHRLRDDQIAPLIDTDNPTTAPEGALS
ncbi:type I-E CRISPR-associated protein Cse2/CasB [Naumannella sp. ID2617S]|nr:type I-E CRISPR-associated protein Cse2/CasB [Naumannella sp. ID2617S]